ncbi:hypothetical protein AMTRI_Chr01g104540 [Amborella trichopoda]
MKNPTCSVCQMAYDEGERTPMLLHCGHGFCRDCLTRLFAASSDHSLSCPRCRHPTTVGNSVETLKKNFPVLSLIHDGHDFSDEEDPGPDRPPAGSICCSPGRPLDLAVHTLRLTQRLGEGRRAETWAGVLVGSGGGCKHKVAAKFVEEDSVWVQGRLEGLHRVSMWCRNVCAFHGSVRVDGRLCVVMDRYDRSVQSEMRRKGRLTLEQILRYGADIARGVAELHAAGIVCMNLKPSNLLLDASDHAVVSDFGLPEILKKPLCRKARCVPEDDASRLHSCMDCTMLSPHYTAPEAWEPIKKSLNFLWDEAIGISAESDAWSFGCTLVEMCTGSVPWAGLGSEEIYKSVMKLRRQPPQYASVVGVGIPRDLWKMIGECLQFKASKRPTFHAMLATFLHHLQEIPRSPPASPDNDLVKDCRTNTAEPSPSSVLDFVQDTPSSLHRLVSEGDVDGVRDLLARAASENNRNSIGFLLEGQNDDGLTALHLACKRGCAELVEAILEYQEADVDVLDKDGDPPIVYALAAGSTECLRALIRKSANVSARLKEGMGPYVAHVCAFHGHPDCMRELLLAGADSNAVDDEGETVLHRAIAKNHTDSAIVILENGGCSSMSITNSKNLTPLHMCITTWNVAVVKKWVEVASQEEIYDAIEIPSSVGTVLCMAAALKKDHETECRDLVRLLLGAGADPSAQELQHGRTALHTAAMANDVEMVKIILDAGVDVNIRDGHDMIPLHVALARGAKSCVGLLLSRGANCNLQDDEGDNAFHIAADMAKMIRENLEWIVVMLQQSDAAVDVRNHSGKTLRDYLEALPREWISEDLMDALTNKGIQLSPTIFDVGDWVKFKRSVKTPAFGWQGAKHNSVGFVQRVPDKDALVVSFCSGEARVLANEVIKVIPLDRGQYVQLKADVKEPRFGWRGQSRDSIGTVLCVDDDGILRVGFPGASRGWKADPAEMERVEEFKVGDWVRIRPSLTSAKHGLGPVTPGSIGIVYYIRPDNSLLLELSYLPNPWQCEPEEVEPVEPFRIGDQVCVKRSIAEPRYAWGGETHHSVGRISEIGSDGLLIIDIPGRPIPWQADPSDMEKVEDFKVGDWVRVKTSVPSPKYGWEDVTRNSIGIVHSIDEDGEMGVGFCFRSKPFSCSVTDMEKVPPFEVGQEIHIAPSITQPRLGWSSETPATTGKIARIDKDGTLNVRVLGRASFWKVAPGDAERLSGFEVGDWVRLKQSLGTRPSYDWHGIGKDSYAVVHSVGDTAYLELASCFRKGRWGVHYNDVEKTSCFKVGHHVRFRPGLSEPRWGWRGVGPESKGVVVAVHADGEVRVAFPELSGPWKGDPSDFEKEEIFEVGEWVRIRDDATEPRNGWRSLRPGSVGIVQGYGEAMANNGEVEKTVLVGFCGEQERWESSQSELERVEPITIGQKVRVKGWVRQPRFGWSGNSHASVGTVVGVDADGRLRAYTGAGGKQWALDPAEVETVEEEVLRVGDWIRVRDSVETPVHQWGSVTRSSIGVVYKMGEGENGGELRVAFCFVERLWVCRAEEVERVRAFRVGDKVRIRSEVVAPRWGWGMETYASRGEVMGVDANGKLRIRFKWREGRLWVGDPADIELDADLPTT